MSKPILDPLWITQGAYLDEEYFNYILLDASTKYKKEISKNDPSRFYEVLFHILNLNNLAVNGSLFTSKFKKILNTPRIEQIKEDLRHLYEIQEDTVGIFKNANYVFLNLVIDYLEIHMEVLEKIKLFHMNSLIHLQKDIFIVINKEGSDHYKIWKLSNNLRKSFGYSFAKVAELDLVGIEPGLLKNELQRLNNPELDGLSGNTNLLFSIIQKNVSETRVANVIKDIVLINKGIAKEAEFEAQILDDLYRCAWIEKMIPFTLDQWVFDKD